MKIKLRPVEQIYHLREIRAKILMTSVQGRAYAQLFERFNSELVTLLLRDDELLRLEDRIIATALKDFPGGSVEKGRISTHLAEQIRNTMDYLVKVASPELVAAIKTIKPDLDLLVGEPLKAKLEESNNLVEN